MFSTYRSLRHTSVAQSFSFVHYYPIALGCILDRKFRRAVGSNRERCTKTEHGSSHEISLPSAISTILQCPCNKLHYKNQSPMLHAHPSYPVMTFLPGNPFVKFLFCLTLSHPTTPNIISLPISALALIYNPVLASCINLCTKFPNSITSG